MDEEATQPATQIVLDPRRLGQANSSLSPDDQADICCTLIPASPPAKRAVALIYEENPHLTITSSNNVRIRERDSGEVSVGGTFDPATAGPSCDLVLRLSANLKDPVGGFHFGRNKTRCDFHIGWHEESRRVSNVHFRIYINEHGTLMLEDQSTNGTAVDGTLLRGKDKENDKDYRHTLESGSVIVLTMTPTEEDYRFIVRIPQREDEAAERYEENLAAFFLRVNDIRQQNHARLAVAGGEWRGGQKYNKIAMIGKGAFATVYKITAKFDGVPYAAKELEKRRFMKNGILDQKVDMEMKIMRKIQHPNVVQYIEHVDWHDYLYIIMEFIPGGDLGSMINEHGHLTELHVKAISGQLLSALKYLHGIGITHRDIKPDNILIYSRDPFHVKLTDFGLSEMIDSEDTFFRTFCGTLLYCAPEVYSEYREYDHTSRRNLRGLDKKSLPPQRYGHAVDIWSLAGVLFYALCGSPPYPVKNGTSYQELLNQIMTQALDIRPLQLAGISENGIRFVKSMLNVRPEHRATIAELEQMSWLCGGDSLEISMDEDEVDMIGDGYDNSQLEEGTSQLSINPAERREVNDSQESHGNVSDLTDIQTDIQQPEIPSSFNTSEGFSNEEESFAFMQYHANPTNGRLFGEVDVSALGSSGAIPLDQLNLPIPSREHLNFSQESKYAESEPENAFPQVATDPRLLDPNLAVAMATDMPSPPPPATSPTVQNHPENDDRATRSSSLLGAESMVGHLNMHSPASAARVLPAYASISQDGKALSLKGDRDGVDVIMEFPESVDEEQQKPEALHPAILARKRENEESGELRRSKRNRTDMGEPTLLEAAERQEDSTSTKVRTVEGSRVETAQSTRGIASELPPNEQDNLVPTDSAYASGTHGKSAEAHSSAGKDLEVITEGIEYTHEDSAFAGSQLQGLYTAGTVYSASETSTLPPPPDKGYIPALAAELFSTIRSCESKSGTLERISEMLPDLLRSFALKLGYKAQTPMHRDVSFFVHKYRRLIQASLEDMFPLEDVADVGSSNVDRIQLGEFAIGRYLREPDFDMYQQETVLSENNEHEPKTHEDLESEPATPEPVEDDIELTPDTGLYLDFIVKTPAYSWLVASLRREATLTRATPDLMEDIRRKIVGVLPSYRKVSRKAPSQEYKATFELGWDPLSFVKEQQYTERPDEALERAITLTGSAKDAQAMTTGQYLYQTWPATGKHVMRLVTDVVRNTIDHHVASNLPDGTEIDLRINGSKFIVTTVGTVDSLTEIGQQFAWLGAALRSSPFEAGVATCSPFLRNTRLENTSSPALAFEPRPLTEIFCVINFEMNSLSTNGEGPPGQCWHNMLRNPVMVSGYPTLTKHERGLGLEMPLNIIAGLAGSERANEFCGKVFIKGFSTMLIATKITRDLLIWHYLYNKDGERISYLDHTFKVADDISLLQLDTARHVVGWCSDSMYYAGAADARYDIDGTGLPRPHAGCLLEKVSISGGKIITGGVTFAVAVKDTPPHLIRNGYIPRLKWIATRYVVLWDEEDKRGWLVNGISALLHLVRTSLEHDSKDDFSSSFLFDPSKMRDAAEHKPNSAINVLIDDDNKEMVIYPGRSERFEEEEEVKQKQADTEESKTWKKKRGYYLFEDLVEQHHNILEQIMDHQRHVAGQNGANVKVRVRKHLEGWDFIELATDHDPYPRVATLQALGYGWVDFIHSIDAITLFGRGFGDIIRPIEFKGMCPSWKRLPTQKYYLGASVFDLNNIMKKFGDKRADPPRIVHDLLWHCPGDVVAPCRCQGHGPRQMIRRAFRRHHDPVQVFYPKRSRLILPIRGPDMLEDGGAVVFGHSVEWPYRWRENGNEDLEEGGPPPSLFAPDHLITAHTGSSSGSSNRGAGSSIASGSTQSRESTVEAMVRSSSLADSAQSTPVESIVESVQAFALAEPKPGDNVLGPSQHTMPVENGIRTLRREQRKLI